MCLAIGLLVHPLLFNELPLRAAPIPCLEAVQGRGVPLQSQVTKTDKASLHRTENTALLQLQNHFGMTC